MIEVVCNDRLGKKVRVKCNEDDTIGDLKLLIAAQTGTRPEKLRIQKRESLSHWEGKAAHNRLHDAVRESAVSRVTFRDRLAMALVVPTDGTSKLAPAVCREPLRPPVATRREPTLEEMEVAQLKAYGYVTFM